MDFGRQKSAGLALSQRSRETLPDGTVLLFDVSGSKEEFQVAAIDRVSDIVAQVLYTQEKEHIFYRWSDFPIQPVKISEKPEVREEGDDKNKVRIFFIEPLERLMMDQIWATPMFKFFMGRGSIGIGHKWSHGGAYMLYKLLHGDEEGEGGDKYFYFHGDFSKLDQSLKAHALMIFTMMCVLSFCPESRYYRLAQAMLAFLANDTAFHYVKWLDDTWRLIIGLMFSGDFKTSFGDTICVLMAWEDYIMDIVTIIESDKRLGQAVARRFLQDVRDRKVFILIYGDDFIGCCPKRWRSILNLKTFADFVAKRWGLTVKGLGTISRECETLLTEHDHLGRVIPGKEGCVFLKRYFVKHYHEQSGKWFIMAWRPTSAYFVRSVISANPIDSKVLALARIHGLMIDTQGTNVDAFYFLDTLADEIINGDESIPLRLQEMELHELEGALSMSKKLGTSLDVRHRPNRLTVLNEFLPTPATLLTIEHRNDVPRMRSYKEVKRQLIRI